MDINTLKTFIAVSEYSGFSAAADKLGYTQSTVSSQIKQLENEFNTVLFDRFYHRIALTQDGETILKYAKNIVELNDKLMSELRAPEKTEGVVRLAMSSSICNRYLKEDFLRFKEKYPEIRLIVTETATEQMFDLLQQNEVDIVFTLDRHIYEPDYIICAEHEEHVHFIVARNHYLLNKKRITLSELCDEEFVLTESNMSYRNILNTKLEDKSLGISPVLEIGNPIQVCDLIANSEMVSFLPDFITEKYIKSGQLKKLEIDDCSITVWTQLLIHKNKWKSKAISAFIDFYCDVMNK